MTFYEDIERVQGTPERGAFYGLLWAVPAGMVIWAAAILGVLAWMGKL